MTIIGGVFDSSGQLCNIVGVYCPVLGEYIIALVLTNNSILIPLSLFKQKRSTQMYDLVAIAMEISFASVNLFCPVPTYNDSD
jgi:hypothetical protein